MPTANVMVKDFWLPEGKKRWVLKAQDGTMYGVPEALSSRVSKGQSYELTYKEDNWNNKTYLVVLSISPAGQSGPGPSGRPEARPSNQPSQRPAPVQDTNKDMHIFVCGAYNNALSNTNIDPFGVTTSEKLKFITEQMEIYRMTLGKKREDRIESGPDSDMNDEIPY